MTEMTNKRNSVSKKQIRTKIQDSVNFVIEEFKIDKPSKRVKKQILKASKKIAGGLANDLKRIMKRMKKAKAPKAVNGQSVKSEAAA